MWLYYCPLLDITQTGCLIILVQKLLVYSSLIYFLDVKYFWDYQYLFFLVQFLIFSPGYSISESNNIKWIIFVCSGEKSQTALKSIREQLMRSADITAYSHRLQALSSHRETSVSWDCSELFTSFFLFYNSANHREK